LEKIDLLRDLEVAADQRGCDEQRSRNHKHPEQFEHALEERGEESAWDALHTRFCWARNAVNETSHACRAGSFNMHSVCIQRGHQAAWKRNTRQTVAVVRLPGSGWNSDPATE
jgi:hypothetical protein